MRRNQVLGAIGALVLAAVAAFEGGGLDALLGGASEARQPDRDRQRSRVAAEAPGDFDYYVLTLSWSPSYCEEEGDRRKSEQCDGGRPYGFVAHGLWPQHEKGWPEFCDVRARVPDRTVSDMLPIMPAKGLIFHQWKKHGTCSGLDPRAYFETVRDAYEAVTIPEPLRRLPRTLQIAPGVIEEAFLEANPDLEADEIVISCGRNRLREVRLCMDKGLEFRRCGDDVHRECRASSVRMPPVRGGS